MLAERKSERVDPHASSLIPVRSRGEAAPQKRVLVPARILGGGRGANYESPSCFRCRIAQFAREFRYSPSVSSSFDAFPRARRAYFVYEENEGAEGGGAMLLLFIHEITFLRKNVNKDITVRSTVLAVKAFYVSATKRLPRFYE